MMLHGLKFKMDRIRLKCYRPEDRQLRPGIEIRKNVGLAMGPFTFFLGFGISLPRHMAHLLGSLSYFSSAGE